MSTMGEAEYHVKLGVLMSSPEQLDIANNLLSKVHRKGIECIRVTGGTYHGAWGYIHRFVSEKSVSVVLNEVIGSVTIRRKSILPVTIEELMLYWAQKETNPKVNETVQVTRKLSKYVNRTGTVVKIHPSQVTILLEGDDNTTCDMFSVTLGRGSIIYLGVPTVFRKWIKSLRGYDFHPDRFTTSSSVVKDEEH